MKNFIKTQDEKAYEQQKRLADTIVSFREARETLEQLESEYDEYAIDAMELDQNDFADELMETSLEIRAFATDFRYIELKLHTTAVTARTLGKLSNLPKAIAECKRFVCEIPNMKKLGADMKELRNALETGKRQFAELRASFGKENRDVLAKMYGDKKASTVDAKLIEEKRSALMAELQKRIAAKGSTPVEAGNAAVTAEDIAKIDAIAKVIDDEKKRD